MATGGEGAGSRLVFTVTEPIALKLTVDSALPECQSTPVITASFHRHSHESHKTKCGYCGLC